MVCDAVRGAGPLGPPSARGSRKSGPVPVHFRETALCLARGSHALWGDERREASGRGKRGSRPVLRKEAGVGCSRCAHGESRRDRRARGSALTDPKTRPPSEVRVPSRAMSEENVRPSTANPLSSPEPWDLVSEGYEEVTREFLGKFSEYGLKKLELQADDRFLDVACGPGTTSLFAAPLVRAIDALDFAPEMLKIARRNAAARGLNNITFHEGDGQNLPFADASFDKGVSMFGLMFFPDRRRGMRELARVLRPGGKLLLSSWAPVDMSSAMRALFGALSAIDPSRRMPERDISSLENPEVFRAELEETGFHNVAIEPVEMAIEVSSPEAFWNEMVKGAAPLTLLRKRIGEEEFARQTTIAHEYLRGALDGVTSLASVAYLAFGEKI